MSEKNKSADRWDKLEVLKAKIIEVQLRYGDCENNMPPLTRSRSSSVAPAAERNAKGTTKKKSTSSAAPKLNVPVVRTTCLRNRFSVPCVVEKEK